MYTKCRIQNGENGEDAEREASTNIVVGKVDNSLQQTVPELSESRQVHTHVLTVRHFTSGHVEPLPLYALYRQLLHTEIPTHVYTHTHTYTHRHTH